MGYCYDAATGRLVCDCCGHADGTVRRRKCPAGWCQATAMCGGCWADPVKRAAFRAYHVENDCAGASARFAADEAKVAALHAAGEYVFCASVYADSTCETVKCWFRNGAGKTEETVVSKSERDAFDRFTTYDDVRRARMSASLNRAYEQEATLDLANEALDGMTV